MSSFSTDRIYFLRNSGRITGPFSQARLHEMLQAGRITETASFSTDKQVWQEISALFSPPPPPLREEEKQEFPEIAPGETCDTYSLKTPLPEQKTPPPPPPSPPPLPELPEKEIVHTFAADVGRVIALVWNFCGIFPEVRSCPQRVFGIAAGLNMAVFTVTALLPGLVVSNRGVRLFPLVTAWLLLASLVLFSLAAGKMFSARKEKNGVWMIPAAALLMDYGMPGGTVLAWSSSLLQMQTFPVILTGFLASVTIACAVVQIKDFLELERGVLSRWIWLTVPLLNAAGIAMIFLFISVLNK